MASSSRKDPLETYRRKRDFARTAEPKPKRGKAAGSQFVVQMHAARRLHYDLRLELDGVLKSWAVTRGPSVVLGEKRLAVRTEDHPVDYLDFEGNIPKGEYGGGSMIVWDRGRWLPQGDPQFGLQKGHLAFLLDGTRLKGLWHLVRIRPRKGEKTEPWLLMKAEDEFARHPGDHEITHNGYRLQARIDGASVRLLTRKGLDWTERFSSLAAAVKKIGLASGLLDGEVVVEDQSGITSFNNLQSDLSAGRQDRFRYF